MLFNLALIIGGLFLLIKSADWLVGGAGSVAKQLGIPNIVIGLTIVAFGTSAPELVVNLLSVLSGQTDLAVANITGSNIANILLILGVCSLVYPITVKNNTVWKEIPLALLAVMAVFVMGNDALFDGFNFNLLTRTDGIMLLSLFIVFLYYTYGLTKSDKTGDSEEILLHTFPKASFMILAGLLGLFFGGKWVVDGAVSTATLLGMSQSLVGLTIVAIGTSLPELVTSVTAALKKQSDIAIGNVVGSNLFNVFWILGLSSVLRPIPVSITAMEDMLVSVAAGILLFLFCFVGKRRVLQRSQGAFFVMLYILYLTFAVIRG
jgi:cation:H+ antiporter